MLSIGIIAAMEEEVCYLREALQEHASESHAGILFYYGKLAADNGKNIQVVLARSGIGKVNAALTCQLMIDRFGVSLVVNTGSAGGLATNQRIGDFVLADRLCHHDIDVTLLGLRPGELPDLPRYYPVKPVYVQLLDVLAREQDIPHHIGTIATGESFIYRPDQVTYIKKHFEQVVACEMEAAAVAQVAYLNEVDVVVIRGLSDIAGSEAVVNFEKYLALASQRSSQLVQAFVARISSVTGLGVE